MTLKDLDMILLIGIFLKVLREIKRLSRLMLTGCSSF